MVLNQYLQVEKILSLSSLESVFSRLYLSKFLGYCELKLFLIRLGMPPGMRAMNTIALNMASYKSKRMLKILYAINYYSSLTSLFNWLWSGTKKPLSGGFFI